jgi:hypothetical protein
MVALNAFYTAPKYQPLIPLRQSAVDMDKEKAWQATCDEP